MLRHPGRAPVAILLAALALLGGVVADAAARRASSQDVDAAFKRLRSNIHESNALSARERRPLLATTRRAQRRTRHHPCEALRTLERLRVALRRASGSRVGGVTAVEFAIVGTRRGAHCARRTRQTRIEREPPIVGGPIKPLEREHEKEDEGEGNPPQRVKGPRGVDPGPPTTVAPASAPGGSFGFATLTDLGSPSEQYVPEEPSQASAGKVVWYTQNTGAAFSLDGGKTFKRVNPPRMFPEIGHAFCCDQVVIYAPQINRFLWYIQYYCEKPDDDCKRPRNSNFVRLLSASPQAIRSNRKHPAAAWKSWIIEPRDLGRRHGFIDYPDLGLGRHSLYVTSNFFGKDDGSVVARIPLRPLAAGRGFALRSYSDPVHDGYRVVQGAARRGFLVTHASARKLVTLAWDEGSPLLFPHRTRHSPFASFGYKSKMADGSVWGDRNDESVAGATRRGNQLWLAWSEGRSMCTARCAGDHAKVERVWAQPHLHVVVVNARTFGRVRERFIHNPGFAIGYPTLATDSRGRVGMTFSYGGGSAGNASPAAGYVTGGEEFRQVRASPASGEQGDYFSLRPDWPDASRFTASGYVTDFDGDGYPASHWLFYRFAR